MIRRPPRATQSRSSAASDVYKRQLVYCGDYIPVEHEYFQLSADEILGRFLPALRDVNPQFSREWVKGWWMHREPYAQPVVSLNHSKNIPPIASPLAGLYWASMSQVYPWDLSLIHISEPTRPY